MGKDYDEEAIAIDVKCPLSVACAQESKEGRGKRRYFSTCKVEKVPKYLQITNNIITFAVDKPFLILKNLYYGKERDEERKGDGKG